MCERISVPAAAKELGTSPQAVREHMRRGIWDLGSAVSPKKTGKNKWEFHIYRAKLDKHIGKEGKQCL